MHKLLFLFGALSISSTVLACYVDQYSCGNMACSRTQQMSELQACIKQDVLRADSSASIEQLVGAEAPLFKLNNLTPGDMHLMTAEMIASDVEYGGPTDFAKNVMSRSDYNFKAFVNAYAVNGADSYDPASILNTLSNLSTEDRRLFLFAGEGAASMIYADAKSQVPFTNLVLSTLSSPVDLIRFSSDFANQWPKNDPQILAKMLQIIAKDPSAITQANGSLCSLIGFLRYYNTPQHQNVLRQALQMVPAASSAFLSLSHSRPDAVCPATSPGEIEQIATGMPAATLKPAADRIVGAQCSAAEYRRQLPYLLVNYKPGTPANLGYLDSQGCLVGIVITPAASAKANVQINMVRGAARGKTTLSNVQDPVAALKSFEFNF